MGALAFTRGEVHRRGVLACEVWVYVLHVSAHCNSKKGSFVLTLFIVPEPINPRIGLTLRLQHRNRGVPSHRSGPDFSLRVLRKLRPLQADIERQNG
jgi:hypothetical protein